MRAVFHGLRFKVLLAAGAAMALVVLATAGVASWLPLVYSKLWPGASSGWWPTTPRPLTSTILPLPSVITQCRLISWVGTLPALVMRTV